MKMNAPVTPAVFVMLFLLILAVFSVETYALSGSGSQPDPWRIESLADFNTVTGDPNVWADSLRLDVDLDLSGTPYTNAPIAPDSSIQFTGTFDGNDRTISGLTIDATGSGEDHLGLFGYLGSTGTVHHLTLVQCDIVGRVDSDFIGTVAGFNYGTIETCSATGSISGRDRMGGLAGYNSSGTINNCYAQVSVTGDDYLGGLIGYSYNGTVSYCYATEMASGDTNCGGLIGTSSGTSLTASYFDSDTGGPDNGIGVGKTTDDMQLQSTFVSTGWDFIGEPGNGSDEIWMIDEEHDYPRFWPGTLSGDGTEQNPFLIESLADFIEFSNLNYFWGNGLYTQLETNIDLTGIIYTTAVIAPDANNVKYDFEGIAYAGNFNGNGHVISNLTIQTVGIKNEYVGLFGNVEFGVISDLGVEDCNVISGNDSSRVGALCGYAYESELSGCYATGSVTVGDDNSISTGGLCGQSTQSNLSYCYASCQVTGGNDSFYIGGLCGYGLASDIRHCYATGTVTGGLDSKKLGGLLGTQHTNTVSQCYATGAVMGHEDVGGLVGNHYNDSHVENCYATGSVTGDSHVGGFCGQISLNSTIGNCYATGMVNGNTTVGGFLGYDDMNGTSVNDCFWDIDTSGQISSVRGAGKTTEQMKTAGTFVDANWDMMATWIIAEDQIYPLLRKYLACDINYDHQVDLIDFTAFASYWLDGVE